MMVMMMMMVMEMLTMVVVMRMMMSLDCGGKTRSGNKMCTELWFGSG